MQVLWKKIIYFIKLVGLVLFEPWLWKSEWDEIKRFNSFKIIFTLVQSVHFNTNLLFQLRLYYEKTPRVGWNSPKYLHREAYLFLS